MRLRLIVLFLPALATAATAQPTPASIVSWTVRGEGARRGGEARVVFEARIAPGWKMYALDSPVGRPLEVALDALPPGLTARTPRQSAPTLAHDAAFDALASTFAGTARVEQPLRLGRRAARGLAAVSGTVRYAVCDDRICLPPATAPFRTTVEVR